MTNSTKFISTKSSAFIATIFLWIGIGSDIIGIITSFIENIFLPPNFDSSEMSGGIMILGIIEIANVPIAIFGYICTIIFFLIWLNRSYKNLTFFNIQGLIATSGWAVGYWFVPIVSLFKPLQIVNEVWHGSDPEIAEKGYGFSDTSTPTIHGFWWATWLISNFLGQISFRMSMAENQPELNRIGGYISDVSNLSSIAAAFLLITIIKEITERQETIGQKFAILTPPEPPSFN